MKKILVRGPALSRSGYGEQTRFALRALRTREDIFEIYLANIPWGQTGFITADDEERAWIDSLLLKTMQYSHFEQGFDMSLQVTIPNEWEKIAPVNVGYTAGIETSKVAPVWLQKGDEMDKIIVVSNHSKQVYETTTCKAVKEFEDGRQETEDNYRLQTKIAAVNYPVRNFEPKELEEVELDYEFNFLAVAQMGPRKNLDNTIKWFVEEFKDEEVGLVVKTNMANDSRADQEHVQHILSSFLSPYQDRKCKVYLLHGTISEEQLTWLYQHEKIKSLVTLTHGEGFGLPIFEAAYNGLPIICPLWSGHTDFLYAPNKRGKNRPLVAKVEYTIQQVPPEAVWPGVIEADAMWAVADESSYKRQLREVYGNHVRFKSQAKRLQKRLIKNFSEEDIYAEFIEELWPAPAWNSENPALALWGSMQDSSSEFNVESWLNDLDLETHD
jgi:hypothetical protein